MFAMHLSLLSTDHETMNESIEGAEAKPWEKRNRHDVSLQTYKSCLLVGTP